MKKIVACLFTVAATSSALASTYTGPVPLIRALPSVISTNSIRFGILVSGTTACSSSGWYGVDLPDTSATVKAWMAILLAAQSRGANVSIGGTGVCDVYGAEGISYIDAVP